jgi:hypothetical protein
MGLIRKNFMTISPFMGIKNPKKLALAFMPGRVRQIIDGNQLSILGLKQIILTHKIVGRTYFYLE